MSSRDIGTYFRATYLVSFSSLANPVVLNTNSLGPRMKLAMFLLARWFLDLLSPKMIKADVRRYFRALADPGTYLTILPPSWPGSDLRSRASHVDN